MDVDATPQTVRPNLSAYLARQIMALIRERNLGPGDRLPTGDLKLCGAY